MRPQLFGRSLGDGKIIVLAIRLSFRFKPKTKAEEVNVLNVMAKEDVSAEHEGTPSFPKT